MITLHAAFFHNAALVVREGLEASNALTACTLHGQRNPSRLELVMVPLVFLAQDPRDVRLGAEEEKGAMAAQVVAEVE